MHWKSVYLCTANTKIPNIPRQQDSNKIYRKNNNIDLYGRTGETIGIV